MKKRCLQKSYRGALAAAMALFSPYEYLQQKLLGFDGGGPSWNKRRPPVDFTSFYQNAVAFASDRFVTESHEEGSLRIVDIFVALAQQHGDLPPDCSTRVSTWRALRNLPSTEKAIDAPAMSFANETNHPHFLAAADEEGIVHYFDTRYDSPQRGHTSGLQAHDNAIFSLKFVPNDPSSKYITGSGDRTVKLFDCLKGEELGDFVGHFGSIRCLDVQRDRSNNVFASGGRDGHVMIWDARSGVRDGSHYPVAYLVNAHSDPKPRQKIALRRTYRRAPPENSVNVDKMALLYGHQKSKQSVTDIVFQTEHVFITAGTVPGVDSGIRFWDLRKMSANSPQYFFSIHSDTGGEFTSLCMDESRTGLYGASMDGSIYRFDIGPCLSDAPTAQFVGPSIRTYYMKCTLSGDEETLGCGSCDGKAYLFQVRNPEAPAVVLNGHLKSEVMGVMFNHIDPYQMATHGEDGQILLWHAEPYLDRSNPPEIIGKATVDHRDLSERTPKRHSRKKTLTTENPLTPPMSEWVHKRPVEEDRPRSPSPSPRPMPSTILRTPNRSEPQKKKRLKNLTLSPFFKQRPSTSFR